MEVPMEHGTLPFGVMYEGRRCRDFTLRPLQARDSLEVRHSKDMRRIEEAGVSGQALADELMGLALLGKRLAIDGVPRTAMTLELTETLWDDDLAEIMAAEGRLQQALVRFRAEDAPAADSGAAQGGPALGGGQNDAGGGGVTVGGGLGGTQHSAGDEGEEVEDPPPAESP